MHIKLVEESKIVIEKPESKIVLNPVEAQLLALKILEEIEGNGWLLDSTIDEIHTLFPPDDEDEIYGEATEP